MKYKTSPQGDFFIVVDAHHLGEYVANIYKRSITRH